jgi:hypothetical protein
MKYVIKPTGLSLLAAKDDLSVGTSLHSKLSEAGRN